MTTKENRTMTAPVVDVLALIDRLAYVALTDDGQEASDEPAHRLRDDARNARAAVAELIEAVQPFATFNASDPTITVRTPDITRLRAALTRCGSTAS
jgi:hypothetical protein